jgi:hypothetical protein
MYNMDGCLMSTQPQGVMECGPKCQEARSKRMKKGVSKTKRAELAEACKVRTIALMLRAKANKDERA